MVVASAMAFRGIPAWRAWVHNTSVRADAATSRMNIARQEIAQAAHTSRMADSVGERYLALRPTLLAGETPAQASAAFASYISETAAMAGVRLGTVQLNVDTSRANTEIYRIGARVDGSGDIRGITTWLEALESGNTPLVAVRTLVISQTDPAAPANRPELLRTTLDIEGIARRDPDSSIQP
jgi:hypothetical protein